MALCLLFARTFVCQLGGIRGRYLIEGNLNKATLKSPLIGVNVKSERQ